MAISYNTGTTASADTAASVAVTIPSGVLVNDVMLMSLTVFTEDSTAPTVSFSGAGGSWTLVPVTTGTNPEVSSGGGVWSYGYAYYRVATSGDPGGSLTVTETGSPSGTTWLDLVIDSYTGANTSSPIDVAGGASAAGDSASSPVTCPTMSTATSGDWAVFLGQGAPGTGATWVVPSGSTTRETIVDGSGVGAAASDSNGSVGASGTNIGGGTFGISPVSVTWFTAFTIGLAPGGAATAPAATSARRLRRVPVWKSKLQFRPTGRPQPAGAPGVNTESGPFTVTLPAPKTTLTGVVAHAGGFNVTLPPPKTTLTGVVAHAGGFSVVLPPPKTSLTGVVTHQGSFTITLPPPKTSLAGTVTHQGSFTITLPAPRTSLAAQITHQGSFTITLPAPFTSLSGSVTSPGEAGAFNITLPGPRTSLSAAVTHKGSFNLTLPVPHLSLSGAPGHNGSFNITLPAPHSSLTAATGHKGSFTITLPALKVSLAGQAGHKGSFTITLPALHTSLSGTVSPSGSGGPLVAALLSGTVTIPEYAGTITIAPYAGTVTSGGPVVPLQQDLNGQIVNNTVVAEIEVTYQGAPLSLSGYTLKVVLKMNRTVADSTGVTFTIGSGIVITDSAEGQFTLTVPYADLPNPATMWYRCDVIDASENPYTALYGNFQVLAA